jgi:hypothetical protein
MVVVNNMLLDYYWPHVICILPRVAEGDVGGEQRAAGLLLASSGTPGVALYLLYCAGCQNGMVVVNNMLLGR